MLKNRKGMKMEEFAKNGSGYFDETAYKAIKRTEEGVMRGEVYEYRMPDGNLRNALIVHADERKHNSVVSFILLCDELPPNATGVMIVMGLRKLYANCERVTYGYRNRIENLVHVVPYDEMRAVDAVLATAFALNTENAPTEVDDECERLKERLYNAEKRVRELVDENQQLADGNGFKNISEREVNLLIERNKLETERDIYKSLFETLQGRMLSKEGAIK